MAQVNPLQKRSVGFYVCMHINICSPLLGNVWSHVGSGFFPRPMLATKHPQHQWPTPTVKRLRISRLIRVTRIAKFMLWLKASGRVAERVGHKAADVKGSLIRTHFQGVKFDANL